LVLGNSFSMHEGSISLTLNC